MSDRYARQLLIENWDQTRIKESTVTVVGLGALGTVVATSLAMAGVGKLILIDFDTVEVSNLNRQLFYREGDVGKPKVNVAAKALKAINPTVEIEEIKNAIEKVPHDLLTRSNVIVEGLDTFKVRRWLNAFTVNAKIPLISGGMYGFLGNIQVVIPYQTPCLECQSLIPEHELQKACTPFGEVRKEIREIVEERKYIPSVSSVSLVIGGLMAQETLKIINGIPTMNNFLFWDGESGQFTSVPLERRKTCFVCSDTYHLDIIPIYSSKDQKFSEFIEQLRYSFNLGFEMKILHGTQHMAITDVLLGTEFQNGEIIRVIDPSIPTPLKFKIYLDE